MKYWIGMEPLLATIDLSVVSERKTCIPAAA